VPLRPIISPPSSLSYPLFSLSETATTIVFLSWALVRNGVLVMMAVFVVSCYLQISCQWKVHAAETESDIFSPLILSFNPHFGTSG